MNARTLIFSAIAVLASNAANAMVYFDTINPPAGPATGYDGPVSDGATYMAASFSVPVAAEFSSIALNLSANTPTDGGSVLVYLVADNGSGGGAGLAGMPTYSGGTSFTGYTNDVLLGTIADSALATTGVGSSLVSLNVSSAAEAAVAATTKNNEYWIALVGSSSSFNWDYNGNGNGIGTAGQSYFNNFSSSLSAASDTTGPYQFQVATPEPTTLAILGVSLAGLGYFRRRQAPKI